MDYTFPEYVPLIAFGVSAIAAVAGGILLFLKKPTGTWVAAFAVSLFAGVLLGPMLLMDRVVLDDEKLEQTTGFWFSPTVKGFRFEETDSVIVTSSRDSDGRENEVWIVHGTDGQSTTIDPGDLWVMHGDDIIERLQERGFDIRRQ